MVKQKVFLMQWLQFRRGGDITSKTVQNYKTRHKALLTSLSRSSNQVKTEGYQESLGNGLNTFEESMEIMILKDMSG